MEKLVELLRHCCPTVNFEDEKELVTGKVIDSMDLLYQILKRNLRSASGWKKLSQGILIQLRQCGT